MLALLAAISVVATPEPAIGRPRTSVLSPPPSAACKAHGAYYAGWDPALAIREGRVQPRRLADLPKPNLERTVLRTIDGCAAPAIVAYSVGR
ncbi:hypothetical protein [uncultured Phenylobacterium sp.]|uniref:hypothetical protein n=1 Tax=uncultured Phenylobacterium sp. TaxID=349273 RepID=UPI0025ED3ACE|nr:hypothetical protein [uncultured Phenylobacterium sp.]